MRIDGPPISDMIMALAPGGSQPPACSFAEHLLAHREEAQSDKAFSFEALGIFGLGGAIPAVPETPGPAPQAAEDAAVTCLPPAAAVSNPVAQAALPPAAGRHIHLPQAAPGDHLSGRGGRAPALSQAQADAAQSVEADFRAAGIPETGDGLGHTQAPAAPLPRQRPAPQVRDGVTMFISETGQVQLAIGAAQLPPEARAALRREAAETVARFGLRLNEFLLNGASFEPPNLTRGDDHGPRPR